MIKTAVLSFFESYNIGDVLIASQIRELFSKKENCDFFDISTGKNAFDCGLKKVGAESSSNALKKHMLSIPILGDIIHTIVALKSKTYKNIYYAVKDYDTVIFAGGNQVMELKRFPTSVISFYRLVRHLNKDGKRICFCFSGVGPFKSKLSEKIAKRIFSLADFISVRDEYSHKWIKKFCPQKWIELWCDPVLLIDSDNNNGFNIKNAIGINTYFGHDSKYKVHMKNAYISIIKELCSKNNDILIYLFSSELTDKEDIEVIKSNFATNDRIIVRNIDSKATLFSFYKEVDIILAARMHTAITATISNLPVLTVAWQEKVTAFMNLMNNEQFNYGIKEFILNPQIVAENLMMCIAKRKEIINKNIERLDYLRNDTTIKLDRFINSLEV